MKILKNSILCLICGTEAISRHSHDMSSCDCGLVFADGGGSYLKRCGENYKYIETSIMDNGDHKLRREHLTWGTVLDENSKHTGVIKYLKIKDMTLDHIKAILNTQTRLSDLYNETFEQELIYRNGK